MIKAILNIYKGLKDKDTIVPTLFIVFSMLFIIYMGVYWKYHSINNSEDVNTKRQTETNDSTPKTSISVESVGGDFVMGNKTANNILDTSKPKKK